MKIVHAPKSFDAHPVAPRVPERRRDPRFRVRMPIALSLGRHWLPFCVADVSYGGLFVQSDRSPSKRQLLRLHATLAPLGIEFGAHGMAVYTVPLPGNTGASAGFGVQLYALDRAARATWSEFVAAVREQAPREEPLAEILFDEPLIVGANA